MRHQHLVVLLLQQHQNGNNKKKTIQDSKTTSKTTIPHPIYPTNPTRRPNPDPLPQNPSKPTPAKTTPKRLQTPKFTSPNPIPPITTKPNKRIKIRPKKKQLNREWGKGKRTSRGGGVIIVMDSGGEGRRRRPIGRNPAGAGGELGLRTSRFSDCVEERGVEGATFRIGAFSTFRTVGYESSWGSVDEFGSDED